MDCHGFVTRFWGTRALNGFYEERPPELLLVFAFRVPALEKQSCKLASSPLGQAEDLRSWLSRTRHCTGCKHEPEVLHGFITSLRSYLYQHGRGHHPTSCRALGICAPHWSFQAAWSEAWKRHSTLPRQRPERAWRSQRLQGMNLCLCSKS